MARTDSYHHASTLAPTHIWTSGESNSLNTDGGLFEHLLHHNSLVYLLLFFHYCCLERTI